MQAFGAAEGENHFALACGLDLAFDGDEGNVVRVDFDDGEIEFVGSADDARGITFSLAAFVGIERGVGGHARGDEDFDALRAGDHVGVGDDVAFRGRRRRRNRWRGGGR